MLDFAELDALVVGVAVLAMKLVVPDSDVSPGVAIAQLNVTNATLETSQMVKKSKALNDHCCSAA